MADTLTSGRAVALAAVTVVAAAGAAGFVAWSVSQPAAAPAAVTTDLAPLVTELRELVRTLGAVDERAPAATREPVAAPARVALDRDPLLQRLDRLITALERRGAPAAGVAPGTQPALTEADRARPIRWDRLRELRERTEADRRAARASIVFSAQHEVIERFGPPTDVEYDAQNRIYLKYEMVDSGGHRFGAFFVFLEGMLVDYSFASP